MAIYKTEIIQRKSVAEDTLEVSLKRPDNFVFKAGQYIQLNLPKLSYPDYKGMYRVFSITSSPSDTERLSVVFRETESGFKRTLKELPIHSPVTIEGPHGFFTLPQKSSHSVVLIAGGIGITPFLSMIRFATEEHLTTKLTLFYANRNKERAAYLHELQKTTNCNSHFTLKNRFGKIDAQFMCRSIDNLQKHIWLIAGPPDMVDAARNTLFLQGVNEKSILYEGFDGY